MAETQGSVFKRIWVPFFILLGVTIVEFAVALAIPESFMPQEIKNFLYIALTLVKAFYIVAFFMHLKFEGLGLVYSIVVPIIFIVALIAALIYEADQMPA